MVTAVADGTATALESGSGVIGGGSLELSAGGVVEEVTQVVVTEIQKQLKNSVQIVWDKPDSHAMLTQEACACLELQF